MESGLRCVPKSRRTGVLATAALMIVLVMPAPGRSERIKDIVDIQGVRSNPLSGIGLVMGLAGTGDTTQLSRQMLTNILRDSGLVLSPTDLTGGSIAAVSTPCGRS